MRAYVNHNNFWLFAFVANVFTEVNILSLVGLGVSECSLRQRSYL